MNTDARAISIDAVRDAAIAVYGGAIRTPLVRVEAPDGATEMQLYLKLEVLQPIGSFKIRGAYNVIRQLTREQLADGVWTVSAGNAALGVAYAARQVGVRCSVMVIDGNATAGLEILEDLPDVDAVVAPVGGGGLLAGLAATLGALKPDAALYGAEPETAAPLHASLAAGRPLYFENWRASFVDGAGGKSVLETMWPLVRNVRGSIVVTLDEVARAIRLTAERAHVIAEGAAGCAVAAALSGRARAGKVVAVLAGGNIDLPRFAEITAAQPPAV